MLMKVQPDSLEVLVGELLVALQDRKPPLPPEPTTAAPGSAEKLEAMRLRVEGGFAVFHPRDAGWHTEEYQFARRTDGYGERMQEKRPPGKSPLSEQIADAIRESGLSGNRIAKLAEVDSTVLHRFVNGRCGLRSESLDRLVRTLDLRLAKREAR